MSPAEKLTPPNGSHWMGTDIYGRDIVSRIILGSRLSIQVGFVSVGIAAFLGTVLGLIAGYYGRVTDEIMMRLMDVTSCSPCLAS